MLRLFFRFIWDNCNVVVFFDGFDVNGGFEIVVVDLFVFLGEL